MKNAKRIALRAAKILLPTIAVLYLAIVSAFYLAMKREIAAADRDPISGIVRGAEAFTLMPENQKPTAACLMIHGFCGSVQDFSDLPQRLADSGIAVRAMRLPGHGTTAPDFAYQAPGAHYKAVHREYLNLKAEFDQVYVVGFSMGGALATLLASREPVDKLVLLAPYYGVTYMFYYILPAECWNAILGPIFPYVPKFAYFTRVNKRESVGKFFCYRMIPSSGSAQLMRIGAEARKSETLSAVKCPTLFLHSPGDQAADSKASKKAFEALGAEDKEFVWLDRSNHVILWDYDSEEVKERVEGFLDQPPKP